MSATSTAFNACDASIWLDDDTGTPRDCSGSMNRVGMNFDHKLGEYEVYQDRCTYRLECGKDASFELVVVDTTLATEASEIIQTWYHATNPGVRTLTIYLPDKNVGSRKYQCEARIEHYDLTPDRGEPGPIIVSATLRPHGCVTYTTVAT